MAHVGIQLMGGTTMPRVMRREWTVAGISMALFATVVAVGPGQNQGALWLTASSSRYLPAAEGVFVRGAIILQDSHDPGMAVEPISLTNRPSLATLPRTVGELPTSLRAKAADATLVTLAQNRLSSAFAGPALVRAESAAEQSLANQETMLPVDPSHYPILNIRSGVSGISIQSFSQYGTRATVSATVDAWAVYGQVQPGGGIALAGPAGRILVRAQLTKFSGGWRIVAFTPRFAPGSSP